MALRLDIYIDGKGPVNLAASEESLRQQLALVAQDSTLTATSWQGTGRRS